MGFRWMRARDVDVWRQLNVFDPAPWTDEQLFDHGRRSGTWLWLLCINDTDHPDDFVGFVFIELRDDEMAVLKWVVDRARCPIEAEMETWDAIVRKCRVHGRPHIAVPDGFRVPIGGTTPDHPIIHEGRQ